MTTLLLLSVVIVAFYWKVLTTQYTWMDHPDMAFQILPWYQFQAVQWHRGAFPLWDPHLWGGQPVLGQVVPGGAYPLNWLVFLAPLKDGHISPLWLNVQFVVTHLMTAFFAYWLCRDLGRSRTAAILAGTAFSAGGMLGAEGWPQMLNGACWAPLVVLFFLRAWRGEQIYASAGLSGAFLGVAFLSGHHQVPVFLAVLMAGLWVYAIARAENRRRTLAAAAAFATLLFLVSALQTLPAYEFGQRAVRWVGTQNPLFWAQYVPYPAHERGSLFPLSIAGMILPGIHDRVTDFVGLTVTLLALTGIASCWRNPVVRLLAAVAFSAFLFSLGSFSIFHGVLYLIVPMVEKARSPHMAIYLCQLALCALAAYGLDALRQAAVRESAWIRRVIPVLSATGLVLFGFLLAVSSIRSEAGREYERLAILATIALALAAVLQGQRRSFLSDRASATLFVLLAIFELGTVTGRGYTPREEPAGFLSRLAADDDVVDFLRSQPDLLRLEIDTGAVPYNIGDWQGLDQFRAYGAGLTTNVAALERDRLQGGVHAARYFSLSHALSHKPLRAGHRELFTGRSGLKVYRNDEARPRVWTVYDGRERFDEARVINREAETVVIDVSMSASGTVVLSDTHYPGWVASIDGKPAPIREAYGALRSLDVGPGPHRIEFRYRPITTYLGFFLSSCGAVIALILGAISARKPPITAPAEADLDSRPSPP